MKTRLAPPLFLAACTALALGSAPTLAQQLPRSDMRVAAAPRTSRDLISEAEMRESKATDAYQLVSWLRFSWLRTRGASSLLLENSVLVYLDGMRLGNPESLRQINTNSIKSIRFLNGVAATARFGTGHGDGVIMITSR